MVREVAAENDPPQLPEGEDSVSDQQTHCHTLIEHTD